MSKEHSKYAFPGADPWEEVEPGMTLRDYFAAKAMQGFCVSTVEDSPVGGWDFKYLAEHAYRCADAMIAEREKE